MSNSNNITLEKLKLGKQAIYDTQSWWENKINHAINKLQKLSESSNPDFGEVEKVENEIENLHKKGAWEQKNIQSFEKISDKYLLSALMSGCLSIKMDGN